MNELFYIKQLRDDWFQLNLTFNQMTFACGNFSTVTTALRKAVMKYKTPERFMRAIRELSKNDINKYDLERNKEYYKEHGNDFASDVNRIVAESLEEVKEYSPTNLIKKRLKSMKAAVKKGIKLVAPHLAEKESKKVPLKKREKLCYKVIKMPRKIAISK